MGSSDCVSGKQAPSEETTEKGQSPHPILSVRGSLSDLGTSIGCSTAGRGCSSCLVGDP